MSDEMEHRRKVALRRIDTLRRERNRGTLKASIVAEGTDFSSKQIAPVLKELVDDGKLSTWGNSTPQTYIIELPEDFQPP